MDGFELVEPLSEYEFKPDSAIEILSLNFDYLTRPGFWLRLGQILEPIELKKLQI